MGCLKRCSGEAWQVRFATTVLFPVPTGPLLLRAVLAERQTPNRSCFYDRLSGRKNSAIAKTDMIYPVSQTSCFRVHDS